MSEIINLVDVKPVLNYLERVCFMHENRERRDDFMMQPQTTAQKLKDKQFVADNKEYLIRSICFGWFKSKFIKTYFTDERIKNCKFITSVTTNDKNAPKWLKAGDVAYVFDETKIPDGVKNELTEIRDYLYNVANAYITKELIKNKTGVKLDALSANRNIGTYDLAITESKKWHSKIKQQKIDLEKSIKDTCIVHDFKNGMKFRQLLTPDALDAESKMMGHCVGDGGYDEGVKKGTTQIYSLRDENEEAHATLEVENNEVKQCKGKENKRPIEKYTPYIQTFVDIKKFKPDGDFIGMGLIKDDRNGKVYKINNIPNGTVLGKVEFSYINDIEFKHRIECKKMIIEACEGVKLDNNVKVRTLEINDSSVEFSDGFTAEKVVIECRPDIKFGKDMKIRYLILPHMENFETPENLVCDELIIKDGQKIKIKNDARINVIDLTGSNDIEIQDGVKCKDLVLDYATNVKKGNNLKFEQISDYGTEYTVQNAKNKKNEIINLNNQKKR